MFDSDLSCYPYQCFLQEQAPQPMARLCETQEGIEFGTMPQDNAVRNTSTARSKWGDLSVVKDKPNGTRQPFVEDNLAAMRSDEECGLGCSRLGCGWAS